MAEKLEVRIITPENVVFSRKAESVSLPGMVGDMEILPGHVSIFSTIKPGQVTVKSGTAQAIFAVGTGFLEVNADIVKILVDSCEGNTSIDPEEQRKLIEEAEDKLKTLDSEDVETRFAFETLLATAKARIEVFERTEGRQEEGTQFSCFVEPVSPESDSGGESK